ncbi:hypothetical protein C8Q80DRAFT_1265078 [Daedaleopsis nitida]|nr:hypothetical protein C8Q80DRAFT_1265078 [Daedaleopsis nitida]
MSAGNVARGLKAAISNPYTSEEAKQRAAERLQAMETSGQLNQEQIHVDNVVIGHKAALANPNISAEAKLHSAKVLESMGIPY